MDRHKVIDDDIAALSNSIPRQLVRSSLYFALSHLHNRDRARFERVCAELRPLEDKARRPDFDWKMEALLLIAKGRGRHVAFERSSAALRCDFDTAFVHFKNTSQSAWPSGIDKVLADMVRPTTLAPSDRQNLGEQLHTTRTPYQAALLIVAANRKKGGDIDLDPETIGTMLRRGRHTSARPRRSTR